MYSMADLLQLVVQEGASDLHIRVYVAPVIRVHGTLHRVDGPPLRPEDTEELMRSITSEDHIQQVREKGGADFGFAFGEVARFRVSVFKTKGHYGIVLRQIPTLLLTLEQIGCRCIPSTPCCASRADWLWSPAPPARAKPPPWPR
jgi:twitching motility protein PilT